MGNSLKSRLLVEVPNILDIKRLMSEAKILLFSMKEESSLPIPIVGRPWLKDHNPQIDWQTNVLKVMRSNGTVIAINSRNKERETPKEVCFKHISVKNVQRSQEGKLGTFCCAII